MKSFQDRLFKDFDVEKVPGKNGKIKNVYVYKGDFAEWKMTGEERERYKRLYIGSGFILVVLFLWKSLQHVPLNSSHLVGGATLLSIPALLALLVGLIQFVIAKEKMYLRDCLQTRDLILWAGMIYFILQIFLFVCSIIYVVLNGVSFVSVLVILADLLSGFLAFVLFAAQNKLKHEVIMGKERMNRERTFRIPGTGDRKDRLF